MIFLLARHKTLITSSITSTVLPPIHVLTVSKDNVAMLISRDIS